MGRRISNGVVGSGGGLGSILVSGSGNTLTTASTNQNLIIDPNGTGVTQINTIAEMRTAGSLRLYNTANTFYAALKNDPSGTAAYEIQLPGAPPAASGYLLTANLSSGNAVCSWAAPATTGITVANDTSTATAIYPLLTQTTTGYPAAAQTTVHVSNNKLSFVPSTGILTSTGFSGPLNGTVGATTAASGSFTTLAASSTVSGTGFSNYLASPPAIGGTAPAAGTFTTITETSSLVLKENINPITNALEIVLQLQSYTYDRKDGSSLNESGLIAEEVNKIVPSLVTKDENGDPRGIHYSKITAYLIEAVKELKHELNTLKGIL